jgi:two-component system, cell cycle sensor histidine kinase and response regulator CckA
MEATSSRENTHKTLVQELEETRARLREVEYTLEAIRLGKADALVISEPHSGDKVVILKRLEVLADSIVEHAAGGLVLVDGRGVVLRANAVTRALCAGNPVGRPFDEVFPFASLDPEPGQGKGRTAPGSEGFSMRKVLAGKSFLDLEVAFTREDGVTYNLLVGAKALPPEAGISEGAVVTLLDITARKRAELRYLVRNKQLRYHFDLTRTITDSATEALFLLDLEGRILSVNPAAERMLGWKNGDLLERAFHELVHPVHSAGGFPSRTCPLGEAVRLGRIVRGYEDVFVRKDGSTLPVHYSNAAVLDEDKVTGAVVVVVDMTSRKETEAALNISEEKLRQSQKMEAVGRLAGGIAHDFNNLLTTINGYADLAKAALAKEHPVHDYLEEIHKSGLKAAALTTQLLAYSRKQVLAPRVVDLNAIVAEAFPLLERVAGENILAVMAQDPKPCLVKVDASRIHQIIMNLATNARDALPRGGRLEIRTDKVELDRHQYDGQPGELAREAMEGIPPGRYARLSLSDSGHGMDDSVLTHLFEPFFTTKEVGKGTGLGLSMVLGITRQSGGYVQVFSEVGRGTTFHILLPLA